MKTLKNYIPTIWIAVIVAVILTLSTLAYLTCSTFIGPGYVGIKVNTVGSQRGVEDFSITTGRVFYNPFTTVVYEYPTFMQTKVWTQSLTEGSPAPEGITFNSQEGAQITCDIAINYSLDESKVPALFVKFRQPIEIISSTYLRNQVRDAFNKVAGKYKAIDIFGEQKQALIDEVNKVLRDKLKDDAFLIDSISLIGSPTADQRVMSSINSVIEATQKAIEAENKVRQIEAEAKQKIAEAHGEAESKLMVAKAEAESNKVVTESISTTLIQYELAKKWNGQTPQVVGESAGLLLNMDNNK